MPRFDPRTKYTPATRRALAKYGFEACQRAWDLNTRRGEGAASIAALYDLNGINTTRQADAAIAAYDEVVRIFTPKEG
jgi:hypothetical protein